MKINKEPISEKKLKGQLSEQEIAALKAKHGELFAVEVGESVVYLKKPDRAALGYASSFAESNPLKFSEIIYKNSFVDGDEDVYKDDEAFLGVAGTLKELISKKHAEIKKL